MHQSNMCLRDSAGHKEPSERFFFENNINIHIYKRRFFHHHASQFLRVVAFPLADFNEGQETYYQYVNLAIVILQSFHDDCLCLC